MTGAASRRGGAGRADDRRCTSRPATWRCIPLLLWPFVAGAAAATSALRRAAVLVGGSLLAAAWVIVPLLAQRDWAASNEVAARARRSPTATGPARCSAGWSRASCSITAGCRSITVFAAVGLGARRRPLADATPDARALLVALARVPAAVVRAGDVRVAGRRDPRQRRHLLPPLHDGRPARGAAAGGTAAAACVRRRDRSAARLGLVAGDAPRAMAVRRRGRAWW